MTLEGVCNIMDRYGELEMRAFLRRSVFALMYKEKCKWCENDRTDGIFYTAGQKQRFTATQFLSNSGRHLDIRVAL